MQVGEQSAWDLTVLRAGLAATISLSWGLAVSASRVVVMVVMRFVWVSFAARKSAFAAQQRLQKCGQKCRCPSSQHLSTHIHPPIITTALALVPNGQ